MSAFRKWWASDQSHACIAISARDALDAFVAGMRHAAEMCDARAGADEVASKGTVYGDPGNTHGLSDAYALAGEIRGAADAEEGT